MPEDPGAFDVLVVTPVVSSVAYARPYRCQEEDCHQDMSEVEPCQQEVEGEKGIIPETDTGIELLAIFDRLEYEETDSLNGGESDPSTCWTQVAATQARDAVGHAPATCQQDQGIHKRDRLIQESPAALEALNMAPSLNHEDDDAGPKGNQLQEDNDPDQITSRRFKYAGYVVVGWVHSRLYRDRCWLQAHAAIEMAVTGRKVKFRIGPVRRNNWVRSFQAYR